MRSLKFAALLAIVVVSSAAPARKTSSADAQLQNMLRCNAITDQTARVVCYDDAARQALAPVPARSAKSAAPAAAPAKVAEQAFGLESVPEARRREVSEAPAVVRLISAQVVARDDDGLGYYKFTLDNGMRWQMTERSPLELPAAGDTATIRRGMIGGYMLDVGRHAAVRVTRLQ